MFNEIGYLKDWLVAESSLEDEDKDPRCIKVFVNFNKSKQR